MGQYTGLLITLESGEGAGKTGHIPRLVKHLRSKGLTVYPTREPGGTSISEAIRAILENMKNLEMNSRTEALLFQAARAQIVEQVIRPRLQQGEVVISDRYYDSTLAYQGYGHQLNIDTLRFLVNFATGELKPDLTVLLKVDPEVGMKRRVASGEVNRLDLYPMDFHKRVEYGYDQLVKEEPERWVVVDANQGIEDVYRDLVSVVENRLIQKGLLEGHLGGKERK